MLVIMINIKDGMMFNIVVNVMIIVDGSEIADQEATRKIKLVKKIKGKSKSWWSCRLANNKSNYSIRKNVKKCNYKNVLK